MKVAFNSSQEDTVALIEAQVLRQRANGQAVKPTRQILLYAWLFFALTIFVWVTNSSPPYFLIAVFAIGLILLFLRQKSVLRNHLRKHVALSMADGLWRPSITEINDAGVSNINQDNITAFWWPQIAEIVREGEYLRFYTHQSSVTQVPRRVFRVPEELDRFEAEARRLWEAHKNDPPISFPELSGVIADELSVPGCQLANPTQSASPSESP